MRAYPSKSQFIVDDFIDQHTIVSNMAIPILFVFTKQAVADIFCWERLFANQQTHYRQIFGLIKLRALYNTLKVFGIFTAGYWIKHFILLVAKKFMQVF